MTNFKSLISIPGLLKMLQIGLGIGCIALLRVYNLAFGPDIDRTLVGHVALGSTVLISLPLLVGYILEHGSSGLEGMYLSIVGSLNFAAGSLAIEVYHDQSTDYDSVKAGLGMGALMILNGLVYFIDCMCRCRSRHAYDPVTRH
ncbi:unnamed protein product [Meganyctiphanes norvegica]|uniref:Protein snakeskin n=1 Tax=Meganyctiphanes norvegica TaxID=48144 RepID=A0AAV2RD15_MEGNR